MLVSLHQAQRAFEMLPAALQLPTLSPVYCAADAIRTAGLASRHLLFQSDAGFLLHSIHEEAVPEGGADWQSPYGYGGPIGMGLDEPAQARAWESFDRVAREHKVIAEFVRFHPLANNERFYPGTVCDDRRTVAVDLEAVDLIESYTARGRNTLRKAQRCGLDCTWEDPPRFGQEFADFYRAGMNRIGARDFYLFEDAYFMALLAIPYAQMLSVRRGAQLLAAGLFLFGPSVVEYHLSATEPEGRALGATNLLLHEAARRAQTEGRAQLYLGGGTDSRHDNALLRFKESFAPAGPLFRIGYRILDAQRYEELRQRYPEQAGLRRVLFYRSL